MLSMANDDELREENGTGSYSGPTIAIPTGKGYAVKIIGRCDGQDDDSFRNLKQQFDAMMRLNHPGLVQLHAIIESQNIYCLIIDATNGDNLADLIKRNGAMNEDTARSYFRQLIDTLEYLHRQNGVQCDLKPEKLLFDESHKLKIADISLSSNTDSKREMEIYTAGTILYLMLTGKQVMNAAEITTSKFSFPQSISSSAVDLIRHILVIDPAQRYTLRQIRAHRWLSNSLSKRGEHSMDDQKLTAFDIIGRITSARNDVMSFSADCSRSDALNRLNRLASSVPTVIQPGTDDYSVIVTCSLPRNDRLMIKVQVLPVDETCVIISGSRLLGSDAGFTKFFKKAKELILQSEAI
jgi:serine/threonine protein kinase